jgi:hypothetical protein
VDDGGKQQHEYIFQAIYETHGKEKGISGAMVCAQLINYS